MRPIQNAGGEETIRERSYPVAKATAITAGQVVQLSGRQRSFRRLPRRPLPFSASPERSTAARRTFSIRARTGTRSSSATIRG